jgi:sigma-B regulation protein RsbU (phosphoserine phosphatase)
MPQSDLADPISTTLEPGDIFGLISDGVYEYENESGTQFGQQRVADIVNDNPDSSAQELVDEIMRATRQHGGETPQADDMTIVLAKRLPG